MTTDILELWQEIAAGAMPDGVKVICDSYGIGVYGPEDMQIITCKPMSDYEHRAAMLLIVDGWERQGWQFVREKVNVGYDWLAFSKEWEEDPDKYYQHPHEREILSLGNVLAELGNACKTATS